MRVLVTGATGLIGRRLVRRLLEEGHEVAALSRNPEAAEVILPIRCECFYWSPINSNVEPDALVGVDAVVHLAGLNIAGARWTPVYKKAILDSRVRSTRALLAAFRELPRDQRPKVFVSAAAIGFYGDRGPTVLSETVEQGEGFLADVCVAWENEIAAAEGLGMRTVGMRTGVVLAREGGALDRMMPIFRLGLGGKLGNGRQWMSWVHIDDLVSMYVHALTNEKVFGPVNAVSPSPVTNAGFTKALGRALRRPTLCRVPAIGMKLTLGEMADLLLGSQRVEPVELERSGFHFDYPDLETALAEICAEHTRELQREVWLEKSPEEVAAFFAHPQNVERITPPMIQFRLLRSSTEDLRGGTELDCSIRYRGIPLQWRARIDVWDFPRTFVQTQVSGGLKSWRHTHEFEAFDGGTIMGDTLHYELRGGVLSHLLFGRRVRKDLEFVFEFRAAALIDSLR